MADTSEGAVTSSVAEVDVLHVEDDPAFAEVAKHFLERCDEALAVTTVTDPATALDRLDEGTFDCVLCDYDMPELTGIELLEDVREAFPDIPFVLFTGKGSEAVASDAFSAGATDYFEKPDDASEYELLAERIATVVEKYHTERRLARSEERYRRLIETAPVPIVVHRGDEVLFANEAAAEFLSADGPGELVGTDPLDYLATDDREVARERVGKLLADETAVDSLVEEYVDVHGNSKHARVAGGAVEYGGDRAVQVMLRDVTERRAYERELERYRQLVEAMGDGIYALDAEGCFEMVNERMTALTGYSRDELLGQYAGYVMTDEGLAKVESAIQSLIDGAAGSVTVEVMARHANGTEVPRELNLTLQSTADDERFAGTVGVVRDITERRAREQELKAQNERLEAFAEIVSHDLRNPLGVVSGYAELARERAADGASGEELIPQLEAIETAAGRMTSLTEDLLTLAEQGETVGDRQPVAVDEAAREVWSTLDTDGATLEVADPDRVRADPTRFQQLLANLLENAVEHGSTGSRPEADDAVEHGSTSGGLEADDAVEHAPDGALTVTVVGTEDGFAVTDDGPGIPSDERDRVFERGYSTADSTGFGLAIVDAIAEAHGWTTTVGESESGGARFHIHTDG